MTKHLFVVRYRRDNDHGINRIHRMTVIARDANEAREYARIRDPHFLYTIATPRKGGTVEPESEDPLTASKRREWIQEHNGYTLVADESE